MRTARGIDMRRRAQGVRVVAAPGDHLLAAHARVRTHTAAPRRAEVEPAPQVWRVLRRKPPSAQVCACARGLRVQFAMGARLAVASQKAWPFQLATLTYQLVAKSDDGPVRIRLVHAQCTQGTRCASQHLRRAHTVRHSAGCRTGIAADKQATL